MIYNILVFKEELIMLDKIIEYISIFLALMLVLPIHEFAHGFAAVKSGDITPKIYKRYTLNPFAHFDMYGLLCFVLAHFGWAKPMPVNPNNFKNYKWGCFWVAIAGVLANYLLAFVAYPLLILSFNLPQFGYFTTVIQLTLYFSFSMSLSFMVFNLLPIYPLDGFRLIDVFSKKRSSFYRFLRYYGIYVLYAFFALSIFADLTGLAYFDVLGNFLSIVTGYIGTPIRLFWGVIF